MLEPLWLFLTSGAIVTALAPNFMGFVARHGKAADTGKISNYHPIVLAIATWNVPKSFFLTFYIVGICTSLIALFSHENRWSCLITHMLLMFLAQNIRRSFECCITNYGSSTLHIGGFIVGVVHYVAVPVSILASRPQLSSNKILLFLAWAVFIAANYVQFNSHSILRALKQRQIVSAVYAVPTGSYFEYVCCPHYSAEIAIYFALWICSTGSFEILLILLWVISNLTVVANVQMQWYRQKFDEDFPPNWKRILPFVW